MKNHFQGFVSKEKEKTPSVFFRKRNPPLFFECTRPDGLGKTRNWSWKSDKSSHEPVRVCIDLQTRCVCTCVKSRHNTHTQLAFFREERKKNPIEKDF